MIDKSEALHLHNVRHGDMESFRWVYDTYHHKVHQYCFRFLRNKEIVDEITSDVFVQFWKKRDQLKVDISPGGLLYKIARNYCIDHLRKIGNSSELKAVFLLQYKESLNNSIEEDIQFKESLHVIGKVINTLPPKRRQVFQMRFENDMTNDQIAKALDISPNTVRVHLTKASNFIRTYIYSHSDMI